MEKIIWKYVKPLKNKKVIEEFLHKYNIELPFKIIQCMIKNNGGRPSVYSFNTDKMKGYAFQSLFSYNSEDLCNIYDIYPGSFQEASLYPIGLESAGNIVCYDLKNKTYILWNHETGTCETIDGKNIKNCD